MQDDRITLLQRVLIRFHLILCEACRHFLRNVSFLHEAMIRYRR